MDYLIVVVLILFSALFSGLTLGLMGLDVHELKRKMSLGNKDASKIYPIRKKGNLLLSTLLIGNVAINATLSIFLGSIVSGLTAAIMATGLIVIFGEIAPQALFSRYALILGARLIWLVKFFIFIFYPFCFPIALALDKILGEEMPTIYSKGELMKIVEEHEDSPHSTINEEEERLIKGALTFSSKKVKDVMTSRDDIMLLSVTEKTSASTINKIMKSGFSRIPVYKKKIDNIVGVLYITNLIGPKNINIPLSKIIRKPVFVRDNKDLRHVFNSFLATRNHLYIVRDKDKHVVGVVTIEDIIEEIIGSEILDERDF